MDTTCQRSRPQTGREDVRRVRLQAAAWQPEITDGIGTPTPTPEIQ